MLIPKILFAKRIELLLLVLVLGPYLRVQMRGEML